MVVIDKSKYVPRHRSRFETMDIAVQKSFKDRLVYHSPAAADGYDAVVKTAYGDALVKLDEDTSSAYWVERSSAVNPSERHTW